MKVVGTCLVLTVVVLGELQDTIAESADMLVDGIFLIGKVLDAKQCTIASVGERCLQYVKNLQQ